MKKITILFLGSILTCLFISAPLQAEWSLNEDGQSEIDELIDSLDDRLYCMTQLGKSVQELEAVVEEHAKQLKLLLQRDNPPINRQDEGGRTPLMRAAYCDAWEIIEILIQAGADIDLVDKNGRNALYYLSLTNSAPQGSIRFIQNIIMQKYNTKERYNKCVDLLTANPIKRTWYKRWVADENRW